MAEWVKAVTDVGVGGGAGVVDQLLQNQDEKREAEATTAGKKFGIMSQYGTYYNYGVPILAIFATALGFLKGDWATRAVVAGSQLAGRKVTKQVTKPKATAWTRWSPSREQEAARQRQLAEARAREARAQLGGPVSPVNIPIVVDEAVLV